MSNKLHIQQYVQLVLGLLVGVVFGFLLQKGGVTRYDVIIGQLLFKDFTVIKIMLTAVATGMIGVHLLKTLGMVQLQPKEGSWGASGIGGLILGVGVGMLGYCPGTVVGAAGQGNLDALCGGMVGIVLGSMLFAAVYPRLSASILRLGDFGDLTLPRFLGVRRWFMVTPVAILLIALVLLLERFGL
jgi:hypothetical protein